MLFQELFHMGMDRILNHIWTAKDGKALNLGAGNKKIEGAVALDYPHWDADKDAIPYDDESVEAIYAFHFLEHCADPVKVLLECQRVLKPGGVIYICVPYYNSQMAAHDLDHKHKFCEETWKTLFACPYYNKNKVDWKLHVNFNLICGAVERNLCLLTQMTKGKS